MYMRRFATVLLVAGTLTNVNVASGHVRLRDWTEYLNLELLLSGLQQVMATNQQPDQSQPDQRQAAQERPDSFPPGGAVPAATTGKDVKAEVMSYLVDNCGTCHRGASRLVAELDVTDLDQMTKRGYLKPGSPEESRIWNRVSQREMPPAKWKVLTRAERSRLYQLINRMEQRAGEGAASPPEARNLRNIVETGRARPALNQVSGLGSTDRPRGGIDGRERSVHDTGSDGRGHRGTWAREPSFSG